MEGGGVLYMRAHAMMIMKFLVLRVCVCYMCVCVCISLKRMQKKQSVRETDYNKNELN